MLLFQKKKKNRTRSELNHLNLVLNSLVKLNIGDKQETETKIFPFISEPRPNGTKNKF
jgi:hypothetical protein